MKSEKFINKINKTCVNCAKPADKFCSRCEDFYCSFECQQEDWPAHRYICKAMPTLRNIHHGQTHSIQVVKSDVTLTQKLKLEILEVQNVNKVTTDQNSHDREFEVIEDVNVVENKPLKSYTRVEPRVSVSKTASSSSDMLKSISFPFRSFSSKPTKPPTKRIMMEHLKTREWKWDLSSPAFKVRYCGHTFSEEDTQFMTLCESKYYDECKKNEELIQEYCHYMRPGYEPIIGEVVLCKFSQDSLWYQGLVNNVLDGEFIISLIMNDKIVNIKEEDNLMKLPEELTFDIIPQKVFLVKNAPTTLAKFKDKHVNILSDEFTIIRFNEAAPTTDYNECIILGF